MKLSEMEKHVREKWLDDIEKYSESNDIGLMLDYIRDLEQERDKLLRKNNALAAGGIDRLCQSSASKEIEKLRQERDALKKRVKELEQIKRPEAWPGMARR